MALAGVITVGLLGILTSLWGATGLGNVGLGSTEVEIIYLEEGRPELPDRPEVGPPSVDALRGGDLPDTQPRLRPQRPDFPELDELRRPPALAPAPLPGFDQA